VANNIVSISPPETLSAAYSDSIKRAIDQLSAPIRADVSLAFSDTISSLTSMIDEAEKASITASLLGDDNLLKLVANTYQQTPEIEEADPGSSRAQRTAKTVVLTIMVLVFFAHVAVVVPPGLKDALGFALNAYPLWPIISKQIEQPKTKTT